MPALADPDQGPPASAKIEELLAVRVSVEGEQRRFGELSADDVRRHAATLGQASGFGHRSRVASVAGAWRELAARMEEAAAATVAELEPKTVAAMAEPLWIVPPGGSLLP
jgi:hypothetical protein